MEKYSDEEKAIADKINYRQIDTACCLTCGNGEKYEDDNSVMCRAHTYYHPDMEDGIAYWFGDLLGICDNYKKSNCRGKASAQERERLSGDLTGVSDNTQNSGLGL